MLARSAKTLMANKMAKEVTLNLPDDVGVLQRRLTSYVIQHRDRRRFRRHPGPLYFGTFSHTGFSLRRRSGTRPGRRNSFVTANRATFLPNAEGTTVHLSMANPLLIGVIVVLGFCAAISSMMAYLGVALVTESNDDVSQLAWLVPPGVFALYMLFCAVFYAGGRRQRRLAERDLTAILSGSTPDPDPRWW